MNHYKDIPKNVFINDIKWKIIIGNESKYHILENNRGATDIDNNRIYISDHLNKDLLQDTLFHEVLHACIASEAFFGYLKPKKDREDLLPYEHFYVYAFSHTLLPVLQNNHQLRAFLFRKVSS